MQVNIPTNNKKYFRHVLEFLRPMPPLDKLTRKQIDILAELIRQYYLIGNSSDVKVKEAFLFGRHGRAQVREALGGVSQFVLNNALSVFRKHNILKGDRINPSLLFNPEKTRTLRINFNFEEDGKKI